MASRITKIGIISLEIIGVILAMTIGLICLTIWQVEHRGLNLNPWRAVAEAQINRALPDRMRAKIGDLHLVRNKDNHALYELNITKLEMGQEAGSVLAEFPDLHVSFEKLSLLKGRIDIHSFESAKGIVNIKRVEGLDKGDLEGSTKPDFSRFDGEVLTRPMSVLARHIQNAQFLRPLRRIDVQDLTLVLEDEPSGNIWKSNNVQFMMHKEEGVDFQMKGHADFNLSAEETLNGDTKEQQNSALIDLMVNYAKKNDQFNVSLGAKNMPVGKMVAPFVKPGGAYLTSDVTLEIDLNADADGVLTRAEINGQAEGGNVVRGDKSWLVERFLVNAYFDPETQSLMVEKADFAIGQQKALVSGRLKRVEDNRSAIAFAFDFSDISLVNDDIFEAPLHAQKLFLSGDYAPLNTRINFSHLRLERDGFIIDGNLSLKRDLLKLAGEDTQEKPYMGFQAKLSSQGSISHDQLMKLWPRKLTPLTRSWISSRILAGRVSNLQFDFNLPPGVLETIGHIPDKNLSLSFDASGVDVDYLPGLPILKNASGKGVLKGNSLILDVSGGLVNGVDIQSGRVVFPQLNSKIRIQEYAFVAKGNSRNMLQILDSDPLRLIDRGGFDPEQISGSAEIDFKITRTIPGRGRPAQLGYSGTATFSSLSVGEIYQDFDLHDLNGELVLQDRSMTIFGKALIDRIPVDIVWERNFYVEDGPARLMVKGVFDSAAGDLLGIATRSFLRGPVDFTMEMVGGLHDLQELVIDADLTNAQLIIDWLDWQKPKEEQAKASIAAQFIDGEVNFNKLIINGEGIDINGRFALEDSGHVKSMTFSRFYMADRVDFGATAMRAADGALQLLVSGPFLDLGPIVEKLVINEETNDNGDEDGAGGPVGFDWGEGLRASLRLDRLGLRNQVVIRDTSLDLWRDHEALQILELAGLDMDLDPLEISLSHQGGAGNDNRQLVAQSRDLGTLLQGIFDIHSIKGGDGTLTLNLANSGGRELSGTAIAENLQVVNAPLLAKLFAAGSLNGLADLVNDQGIGLEQGFARFRVNDGRIHFEEARAIGPSVGLTAKGSAGLNGQDDIEFTGSLAPVYQVNSFLGNVPLVGDLLVNRKGEGVLALSYSLAGAVQQPEITINPLSVLAPGVFRRIFEPPTELSADQP